MMAKIRKTNRNRPSVQPLTSNTHAYTSIALLRNVNPIPPPMQDDIFLASLLARPSAQQSVPEDD